MDRRARGRVAKFRRQTDQHVGEILHGAQEMGIHLPNLRNIHSDKEAPIGHVKIPRQAQDLIKKHLSRQIRLFLTDERQRLHGLKLTLSVQEPVL